MVFVTPANKAMAGGLMHDDVMNFVNGQSKHRSKGNISHLAFCSLKV